jgi:hypothetical protein
VPKSKHGSSGVDGLLCKKFAHLASGSQLCSREVTKSPQKQASTNNSTNTSTTTPTSTPPQQAEQQQQQQRSNLLCSGP